MRYPISIGIGIIIIYLLGFIMGRMTHKVKTLTEVEYIKLPTKDSIITVTKPIKEFVPSDPEYIYDTITKIEYVDRVVERKVDTVAILKDWIIRRTYSQTLFDDSEIGKLDVALAVQYNKLDSLGYSFTPIMKVERTESVTGTRTFIPYVGVGYFTSRALTSRVGLFYHNLGLEYSFTQPLIEGRDSYHGFGLNYKF